MTSLRRRSGPSLRAAALVTALAAGAALAPSLLAQSNLEPEEFSAFAINMGAHTQGTTATVLMTVNRWSSESEKTELFGTLREKGPQALLDALQKAPRVGTIRTPQSVGYDLRLALQEAGKDGGRRIIVATDRPIGFNEATNRPITIEYPFTIIDMQLPVNGKG